MPTLPDNPLANLLDAAGARWGDVPLALGEGSYRTPLDFGDRASEYARLRIGACLVDLTARGTLTLTGADRKSWLHGLCTQQIKALSPLEGAYACHTNIKGRVLADFWALDVGEMLVLDVEPGVARKLRRRLKGYKVMEDVKLLDRSDLFGSLGVIGPRAGALLSELAGEAVEGLPAGHGAMVEVAGVECLAVATGQFGPAGYRVSCVRDQLPEVWEALAAREVAPAGFAALEKARVRAGRPRFGPDLNEGVLFNEAGLADAVSYTKGCYLGQEIVERVDARGNLGRRLMALRLVDDSSEVPAPGAVIENASRKLGAVTSAAYLDDVQRVVALGYVHRADNEPGAELTIEGPGGQARQAVVCERGEAA